MKMNELKTYVESNNIIEKAEEFLKDKQLPIAEFVFNITKNTFTLDRQRPFNCKDEVIVLREHKGKIEWYALPITTFYLYMGNHMKMITIA